MENLPPSLPNKHSTLSFILQVCPGDLVSQTVCVIVNPSNPKLEADCAVTEALAAAGGPAFSDSCKDILAANSGQMSHGETAVTVLPAGATSQLKSKYITHAVMPQQNGKTQFV